MTSTVHTAWTAESVRALGLHTSVGTAAEILGIGRSTAYDLIARGEFPVATLRLGRRIVVPTEPLLEVLGASGPQR